ncbi:MAG: hypothetical protein IPI14_13540 [Polaromonas sp.]|nr:hypothetical protein [Polaromonas sp.]
MSKRPTNKPLAQQQTLRLNANKLRPTKRSLLQGRKKPNAPKKVPLQSNLKSAKELKTSVANANGAPRLVLENAPLLTENQIMLKLTTDLLMTSKTSDVETPEHAQSMAQARAIWHALNAKTEDLAADAMKLQDTTVQLAAQNQNNLDLSAKLRVAEQHTYTNSLVYALGALLALALVAVAWLWFKNRKASQAGYAWLGEEARAMPPLPLSQQTIEFDQKQSRKLENSSSCHPKVPQVRGQRHPSHAQKNRPNCSKTAQTTRHVEEKRSSNKQQ